ncbi:neural Wiskott-Aldrich syndrome protein [Microdochium nivale]|nr:neural Wiskott-Aldrich syndrome protein [Microdochium nivale]
MGGPGPGPTPGAAACDNGPLLLLPSSETQPPQPHPPPSPPHLSLGPSSSPTSSDPVPDARASPPRPSSSSSSSSSSPPVPPSSSAAARVQYGSHVPSSLTSAAAAEHVPASGPPLLPTQPQSQARPDKGKAPLGLDDTGDLPTLPVIQGAVAVSTRSCTIDAAIARTAGSSSSADEAALQDPACPDGSSTQDVLRKSAPGSPRHPSPRGLGDALPDGQIRIADILEEVLSSPRPSAAGSSRARDDEAPALPARPLLRVGEAGWERSADRPPAKLPIRFRDAVGRLYVFPWEKANTWEGMRHLINTCFSHVEVVGPHVFSGHYDLHTAVSFSMDCKQVVTSFGISDAGTSSAEQAPEVAPTASTAPGIPATEPPAASRISSPAAGIAVVAGTAEPLSAHSSQSPATPVAATSAVTSVCLLPELWEMLIEPGMLVTQSMWPMSSFAPPPPPPLLPHHHFPPPPPPPPPGIFPGMNGGGRGRGRGRGGGVGRGGAGLPPPPPPPHQWMMPPPPPPPGFVLAETTPRRAKTRKRRG